MIEIEGLSKSYGELQVLDNLNARIKKGECIGIIGPSGTGKSVFLRSIAMLEKPDKGAIIVEGKDITQNKFDLNKLRERMGMVYQGFHLFSHLSVLDNITLAPIWIKKQDQAFAEIKAKELLSSVGLFNKADNFPSQLSGGQKQRIAIARCLAMEPEIMLFDEPTSALDPTMTFEVLTIIRKLAEMGMTMLIVTHEMDFARDVSDRIFYMDECGIYEEGPPSQIFENPQKEKTKNFIKKLKVLNYKINSKDYDMVRMNAHIAIFCKKYNLNDKRLYHIQLILEELIMEIIKTVYEEKNPEIEFELHYSSENDEIHINLDYKAEEFNPFESSIEGIENLGMLLVKRIIKDYEHIYEDGHNEVKIYF